MTKDSNTRLSDFPRESLDLLERLIGTRDETSIDISQLSSESGRLSIAHEMGRASVWKDIRNAIKSKQGEL